jgi:RNA polymerase sigma-70 factor (ECF subfamily)
MELTATEVLPVRAAPADFDDWVRPHTPSMRRLAARLAPQDADDVVQDALARAWRKRSTYDEARGSAQTWLLAIVADQARRTRRRLRAVPLIEPPAGRDHDADLDLEHAIAALSRRQREVITLHYFLGLGVAETAAVLGCADGTVKSTLSDARARLRTALEVRS